MRCSSRAALALIVLGFAFAGARAAEAKVLYGVVTAVEAPEVVVLRSDAGDVELRLFGVDAPEPGQPFAADARAFVERLVGGQQVRLRFAYRDARGEMVGRLWAGDLDVGLALVRAGLAWRLPDAHYKPEAKGQLDALAAADAEARAARRGLWADPRPTPPWTFRGEPPAEPPTATAGEEAFAHAVQGIAGATDQNLSQKSGNDSECAIAKNPANPNQLFVLCNTSGAGLFAARSTDGGVSWGYPDASDKTIADGDAGQGASACCDPTLAWDSFGNLYVVYINAATNQIVIVLSTDGGATFSDLTSFTGSVDQPTVVAADTTGGVAVWVMWNESGSMSARGAAVSALGSVGSFSALQTAPGTSNCSFGDVAIAPSGVLVQVCETPTGGQGPASLLVNTDPDGLGVAGFGSAVTATSTNVGGFDFIPPQNSRSVDAEAGLAYDRNPASPSFGRLYLMYTDETVNENNDTNVLVRTSGDDGATWSTPVQVNDDATTTSQFLPKIATDPVSGRVAVCWHDCRHDTANDKAMELFCSDALPTAGAPVFTPNVQVSDGASISNGQGVEFGDFMGLAMGAGVAHPSWADTSNSTGNNPNGTSSFDAYSDRVVLFADGFESGDTSAWSLTVP
jgi:endonuclease YncB( thermonuclease family)